MKIQLLHKLYKRKLTISNIVTISNLMTCSNIKDITKGV